MKFTSGVFILVLIVIIFLILSNYYLLVENQQNNSRVQKSLLNQYLPTLSCKSGDYSINNSNIIQADNTYGALRNYTPICDLMYNISGSFFLGVVPRRAYYDNRTLKSGHPRNMVIIVTEMLYSKVVANSILSCELNGYYSNVNVTHEGICRWVRQNTPQYTHCSAYIQCTGFPKEAIKSGSIVKVIYKRETDTYFSRVATEKLLVIMNTGNKPTAGKNTIVVCSTLYGEPPYFIEWLKYQKALGVDKVHLSVEKSFANNATAHYPFLREALKSGFAHMEVWENYIGDKIFYYSQVTKYQDCVMQYTGVYEFAFITDSDDFFIPLLSRKKSIHNYTKKFFSNPRLGSVRLWWRKLVCKPNAAVYKTLPNGNVTQSLQHFTGYWQEKYVTKSIHKLFAIDLVGVHAAEKLFPGYRFVLVERTVAYVAHMRPNDDECYRLKTIKPNL